MLSQEKYLIFSNCKNEINEFKNNFSNCIKNIFDRIFKRDFLYFTTIKSIEYYDSMLTISLMDEKCNIGILLEFYPSEDYANINIFTRVSDKMKNKVHMILFNFKEKTVEEVEKEIIKSIKKKDKK